MGGRGGGVWLEFWVLEELSVRLGDCWLVFGGWDWVGDDWLASKGSKGWGWVDENWLVSEGWEWVDDDSLVSKSGG